MCIAPRRQDCKEKYFPFSPNLACFASSRETQFIRSSPHRAKTPRRKENFFDPPPWRPLWFDCAHHPESIEGRLRGSPRGVKPWGSYSASVEINTPQGSPRGIPTRPRSSYSPEALFHRASHRLSDSLNPNSTENFKYVWLGFSQSAKIPAYLQRRFISEGPT